MDGSLQLFGRAPMAAFTGDAAQNREKERRQRGEREGERGVLSLSLLEDCVFSLISLPLFYLSDAFRLYESIAM